MAPPGQEKAGLIPRLSLLVSSGITAILGITLVGLGAAKRAFASLLVGKEAQPDGTDSPIAPGSAAVGFGVVAFLVGVLGAIGAYKSSRHALLAYHVLSIMLFVGLIYSATLAALYRSAAVRIIKDEIGSGQGDVGRAEQALHGLFASFIICAVFLCISLWSSANVMGWAYTLSRLGSTTHVAVILFGVVLISICVYISGITPKIRNALTLDANFTAERKEAVQNVSNIIPYQSATLNEIRSFFNVSSANSGSQFEPSAVWLRKDNGQLKQFEKKRIYQLDDEHFRTTVSPFVSFAFEASNDSEEKNENRTLFITEVQKVVSKQLPQQVDVKLLESSKEAAWAAPGAKTAAFLTVAGAFTSIAGIIGLFGIVRDSPRLVCYHLTLFLPLFIVLCTGASFAVTNSKTAVDTVSRRWNEFAGHEIPVESLQYLLSAYMRTVAALGSLIAVLLFASMLHSATALLVMTSSKSYASLHHSDIGDEEEAHLSDADGALESHLESVDAKRKEAGVELQSLRKHKE